MNDASSSHGSRRQRISWLTVVLALLAVVTFFAISRPDVLYVSPMEFSGGGIESTGSSVAVPPTGMGISEVGLDRYYPYPDYNKGVPATDTREFLKVNYDASIQTRDVQGLTRRVETIVRGHGGRIDQVSSSPRYGYLHFVVPMSKYDEFRDELESITKRRFLAVNVASQNLLPQKQSIEEQQKQAGSTLVAYKAARQKIVTAHTGAVGVLQSQIDADMQLLDSLRAQAQTPSIQAQIQEITNNLSLLQQQMANESAAYLTQLRDADANIKNAQDWQTAVKTQDQALLDDVATVTGSVSLKWISYWAIAQLYLPGYWIPAIFVALAFLSFLWDRRRFMNA